MSELQFTLGEWQGPLDLLLHLIAKHKMDITHIPIVELLEQYMAYLDRAPRQDLDEAADFLEMAARLVYIKTVMLLPRPQEAETLKRELVGELLEYQLCREVARELGEKSQFQQRFSRTPQKVEEAPHVPAHDVSLLAAAYLLMVGKRGEKLPLSSQAFAGIVHRRFVPVSARITAILALLYRRERVGYGELFSQSRDRSELVATFLAVLELVRTHRVLVEGEDPASLQLVFAHPDALPAGPVLLDEELEKGAAFWDEPDKEGEEDDL